MELLIVITIFCGLWFLIAYFLDAKSRRNSYLYKKKINKIDLLAELRFRKTLPFVFQPFVKTYVEN